MATGDMVKHGLSFRQGSKLLTRRLALRAFILLFFSSLFPAARAQEIETIDFSPDRTEWKVGNSERNSANSLTEFVPTEETVDNWRKLFTIQSFVKVLAGRKLNILSSAEAYMNALKGRIVKGCPNAIWNVIEKSKHDILYEMRIANCPPNDDQYEIARIMDGKLNLIRIAYTRKVPELSSQERDQWMKVLRDSKIVIKQSELLPSANGETSSEQARQTLPAKTPGTGAVSSQGTTVASPDLAQDLSAKWGQNPTPNVRFELKEVERTKSKKGGRFKEGSTEVTYRLEMAGFPIGHAYTVWGRLSGNQKTFPLSSGYSADSMGRLVCPEESPEAKPAANVQADKEKVSESQPLAPTEAKPRCMSLLKMQISMGHYHKGEPLDWAAVSTDGTVRAFAHAYLFPIRAQDGKCSLAVELEDPTGTSFIIRGEGFDPGENVKTSSTSGKETTEGTQQASAYGEFNAAIQPGVKGKDSGSASFTAVGNSCHPSVTFEWGKAAMKIQ